MGTEQSKPKASSSKPPNYKIINGAIFFTNGDKYIGDAQNGQLHGNGIYHYRNGDTYKGEWRWNRKHGYGIQIYVSENKKYVGYWQDNLPHGEGTLYYSDNSYYFGHFLEGEKHGKGAFHDAQGDDYDEEWINGELLRRAPKSPCKRVSPRSRTTFALNKRRSNEDVDDIEHVNQGEITIRTAPKSEGDDQSGTEDEFYEKEKLQKNYQEHEDTFSEKQLHSNILFKSRNEYDSVDIKSYDVGLETLNIIEHIEILNSAAAILLNKDVQHWTYNDVGDWLNRIGLNEYTEIFKQNHIDGKVLFELTEADLKDEFNMTSVGHRKNFVKAVDNLKKIYVNDNQENSSNYVQQKIQKFYERNRHNHGLVNGLCNKERRFFSTRLYSRPTFNSQHQVIDEDEEFSPTSEKKPSPLMVYMKGQMDFKDEFKLNENANNKNTTPKKKKEADEKGRSLEELDFMKQIKLPSKTQLSKKTLSKASLDSDQSSPSKETQITKDYVGTIEEVKNESAKKTNKASSNSNLDSSSDSSTDSEQSDDEKGKKATEKPKQGSVVLDVSNPKFTKQVSKGEKKAIKKTTTGTSQNYKSLELPCTSKQSSKGCLDEKKKRQKHANNKVKLNEKIKEEILRSFKESGLNENFIIDYNELSFDQKVGEGGYGRVFLGKFAGTDVAIKEYGKTKLDIRRAEDFVKEVQVISNLRHPNIVLCMGACIHDGKYLMITEYLEEGSLFDHLHKKHTKISDETMFNIIEDIALGMCYLHGRKVFHCDLKSSNILIDSSWSVKLCDFGLSRVKYKSDRKRFQKQRVGTPHWMAPEILRGEKYDEAADVYSFGMILWELVTGNIPYYNMPITDIITTVGHEGKQVVLPSKGNPIILGIISKCLSLKKEERPKFKQIVDQLQQRTKSTLGTNKKTKTWF